MKFKLGLKSAAAWVLAAVLVFSMFLGVLPAPASAAGETAQGIACDTLYTGAMASSSAVNWYKFTLPKDGMVTITFGHDYIDNSSTYWKTTVCSLDNTELMSTTWKGNATVDADSSSLGLAAGTYYLKVGKASYSSTKAYHFVVNYTASNNWEKEHNETIVTANPVPMNTEINGAITASGDDDWYCFTLSKDGVISLTFAHEFVDNSSSYWKTAFYTEENKELAKNTWKGNATVDGSSCSLGLAAGTYYLHISKASYSSTKNYRFTVNYTVSSTWEKEFNETIVAANQVPLNTGISGSIRVSSDDDWYCFTLPVDDTVTLQFSHEFVDSSSTYWTTAVYTENNSKLQSATWKGNAVSGSFGIALSAGTYYLRVSNASYSSSATYTFSLASSKIQPPTKVTLTSTLDGITVSWLGVSGAEKYRVIRTVDGVATKVNVSGTSWTDTNVEADKTHTYCVQSRFSGGTYSAASESKSLYYPLGIAVKVIGNKASVSWTAVKGTTKYQLYRRPQVNGKYGSWELIYSAKGTSFVDDPGAGIWQYRVRAVVDGVKTPYSNRKKVTIP